MFDSVQTADFLRLLPGIQCRLYAYIISFVPDVVDAEIIFKKTNAVALQRHTGFERHADLWLWIVNIAYREILAHRLREYARETVEQDNFQSAADDAAVMLGRIDERLIQCRSLRPAKLSAHAGQADEVAELVELLREVKAVLLGILKPIQRAEPNVSRVELPPATRADLMARISSLIDGNLTREAQQELEAILSDEEARRIYCKSVAVHALLNWEQALTRALSGNMADLDSSRPERGF